tara:strand:+ start:464 stop:2482 length:2019 start_codon:yes stop_codon:yes gene_type:complete
MAKMDDIEFHSLIRNEVEQAVNYHDAEYAGDRIEALDYYLGNPLGNEQAGRSQVVQTEVADVIEQIKPSLMRIFAASDDYVKFEPRGPEDVEAAAQATEYVNYILNADNEGFAIMANWFTDALLFKMGVVKHVFDESEKVIEDMYDGLTEDELTALLSDDDVKVIEQEEVQYGEETAGPEGEVIPPPTVYNVKIRKTQRDGRIRIENVPPEEFLFNQRAKSLDDCRFVAHRSEMTVSDLVELGYDRDLVERHAGPTEIDTLNEKQERFETLESQVENTTSDISQRDVLVTEVYIKADYDGDGMSEIRRVVALGSGYEIVDNEPYHMMPFSVISPILMPHRMVGRSVAELLIDLQQAKTAILRQLLDNIYLMNNSRVGAVEGQVNLDDLMSNRPGGIVRMRAPGMVQPLAPPSVADAAFPLLTYMDEVREMRTGMSKASMGLDADALQSSTAAAVNATVSAAQGKIEMIARTFAETGVKRLMKCILQLVQKHQQQPRIVRLRNNFVTMDPQAWENEFDIVVNVGLGNGDQAQRAAVLGQVAAKQEQILLQMGMDNPLCTLGQYRNTLVKMLESSGFKNGNDFFLDPANLPPDVQQRFQQKMQQASQGGDSVERMKAEAEIQLEREKMMAELQLKREELEMKMALRKQEMEFEAQLRGLEAATGANISTNIPRA